MIASFETMWKVCIKNRYSITYSWTTNTGSRNRRNFVSGRPGMKNFNHPRTGNKQFFEFDLSIGLKFLVHNSSKISGRMFVLGKLSLFLLLGDLLLLLATCFLSVYFIHLTCTSTADDFISLTRDKHIADICYMSRKIPQAIHEATSSKLLLNQCIQFIITLSQLLLK